MCVLALELVVSCRSSSPPLSFLTICASVCLHAWMSRSKMHDRIHWLPTDPRDLRSEDWDEDVSKYAWTCRAYHVHRVAQEVDSAREMGEYLSDFVKLDSPAACGAFQVRWGTKYLS